MEAPGWVIFPVGCEGALPRGVPRRVLVKLVALVGLVGLVSPLASSSRSCLSWAVAERSGMCPQGLAGLAIHIENKQTPNPYKPQ